MAGRVENSSFAAAARSGAARTQWHGHCFRRLAAGARFGQFADFAHRAGRRVVFGKKFLVARGGLGGAGGLERPNPFSKRDFYRGHLPRRMGGLCTAKKSARGAANFVRRRDGGNFPAAVFGEFYFAECGRGFAAHWRGAGPVAGYDCHGVWLSDGAVPLALADISADDAGGWCDCIFLRYKTAVETSSKKFLVPVRWTMLVAALAAATGFLWFAAAPQYHWWIFVVLALGVVWLEQNYFTEEKNSANNNGDLALFGSVTLLVAAVGFAAFLWYAALPTEPWYFIPLLALAAVCFEIGLPVRGHVRAVVLGFSIVVVGFAGVVVFADQKAVNWRLTNVDLLCPHLAAAAAPEDLVVVSPWYCGIPFQRYFKSATPWETAPPISDHSLARYDLICEQMKKSGVMQPLMTQAEATLRAGNRVWLVGMMAVPAPGVPLPADLPPPPLPHSGWADRPYTVTWVMQLNQFLSNHSREFKMVYETPVGNLNFMENLQLYRVEGWHD